MIAELFSYQIQEEEKKMHLLMEVAVSYYIKGAEGTNYLLKMV